MPAPSDLIHQTATSTGTGNFTLVAVNGKRSFNDGFGTGGSNVFDYYISSRDAAEWERGTGSMSDATTLVRDIVIASSNSNAAVNFAAGTKDVTNDVPAAKQYYQGGPVHAVADGGTGQTTEAEAIGELIQALTADATPDWSADYIATYDASADTGKKVLLSVASREKLAANRTYYVRTDGSDSNTGLANTSGGAFLTINKAINTAAGLDLSIYSVTIQVGAGTYTTPVVLKSYVGVGPIRLTGDTTTPGNVIISTTSNIGIAGDGVLGAYYLGGFKIQTTTGGGSIQLRNGTVLFVDGAMEYGACAAQQIALTTQARMEITANYTISGGGSYHIFMLTGALLVVSSVTTTVSGTPAFSSAFCLTSILAGISSGAWTISGSATGKRYDLYANSVVSVGGSATFFPGNVAGTAVTGAQYI